jgi:hypothetical protein
LYVRLKTTNKEIKVMLREIKNFVEILEQMRKEHYDTGFGPTPFPEHIREHIEVKINKKYAKLMCVGNGGDHKSVWGFIALVNGMIDGKQYSAGDLLKPASFNKPAPISRGSILDGTAKYDVYGPLILQKIYMA